MKESASRAGQVPSGYLCLQALGPFPPEFCGLEWVTGSDVCWSPAGGVGSKAKFLESKEAWQVSLGRPACKRCPRLPGSTLCAAGGATRRQEMPPCHRPGSHHLGPPQKGLPREGPARGACCSCVFGDFWQAWAKAAWVPPVLAWMKVGAPAHFLQEPHVHCLFCCGVGQSQPSPHCVGLAD